MSLTACTTSMAIVPDLTFILFFRPRLLRRANCVAFFLALSTSVQVARQLRASYIGYYIGFPSRGGQFDSACPLYLSLLIVFNSLTSLIHP